MGAFGDFISNNLIPASGFISGIAGTIGNFFSARQENQRFQQQLAWQKEQYERDLANSWDMFNATNDWNSEISQSQRLKQAGINPQLEGVGSSSASPASLPSGAGYGEAYKRPVPNYAAIGDSLLNGFSQFMTMMSAMEDLRGKQISNDSAEMGQYDKILSSIFSDAELKKVNSLLDNPEQFEQDLSSLIFPKAKYSKDGKSGQLSAAVKSDSYVSGLANKLLRLNPYKGNRKKSARFLNYSMSALKSGVISALTSKNESSTVENRASTRKINSLLGKWISLQNELYDFQSQSYRTDQQNKEIEERVNKLKADITRNATDLIKSNSNWDKAGGYLLLIALSVMQSSMLNVSPGVKGGFGASIGF